MSEATPPPDGELGAWFRRKLGASWKTSLAGRLTQIAALVGAVAVAIPDLIPARAVALAGVVAMFLAGQGVAKAKDHDVTGGDREND